MTANRDPNSSDASDSITKRIQQLFNSSLEGNTRRAIDIREGEMLDDAAFKALIRSAVAANADARARRASPKK